ncbi:semaphorin-7A isoform X2 [Denticeps clupeoides]|uniref:semaphorin-7A isoform X2 n=1 Tax=Denticeps clupeoides TaxID=299321 RepID=UPI0010A4CE3A|nr:semaphorin-7A isoform X2 [Denticeps clupeoides]
MKTFFYVSHMYALAMCIEDIPRRTFHQGGRTQYEANWNHTVFFYHHISNSLFIGGTGSVLHIDLEKSRVVKEYPLATQGENNCIEESCENTITLIEQWKDGLLVCGTNGGNPQCWVLDPQSNSVNMSCDGSGIAPYISCQNSLSLTVDGELYTAAPLFKDGTSLHFRRKLGLRADVWMYDKWVSEPTFISAFCAKRETDPDNEKMYVFFREKNLDNSPEADPWISRVARVCKVDEGGSKRFFQNIWTSFLKARLVCGVPRDSLYFNRLQDVYVIQNTLDWRKSLVYGLFSSSWNATAICIYSLEEIDRIFEQSTFKGFNQNIPQPRPGTCVKDSKTLPAETMNVIKEHSEMSEWIQPIHTEHPFHSSRYRYTRILVDTTVDANKTTRHVLLLSTDQGVIHKILEYDFEAFIISETRFDVTAPIQSMALDTQRRRLLIGFPGQVSYLDLQNCQGYNKTCGECVLARDPYCSWTQNKCTSEIPRGIQNIVDGHTNVCRKPENATTKKLSIETPPDHPRIVYSVPRYFLFYLSCPMDSHHAEFTWEHNEKNITCQKTGSTCLHLIPSMTEGSYGSYRCISRELDFKKVVTEYELKDEPRSCAYMVTVSIVCLMTVMGRFL